MGIGGVGKSAITNRYHYHYYYHYYHYYYIYQRLVMGRWIEKYDPTIEESYQTTIDIDGKALLIEILDTAGQEAYSPLRETFMSSGDGFLLVYSITDDQTLEELRDIRKQILRVHKDKRVPMAIVGNKTDLSSERAVSSQEGKALANEFNAMFLEISAKNNKGIKDAFEMLIRRITTAAPNAGRQAGSGNVFGAGKSDSNYKKKSKKRAAEKTSSSSGSKSSCLIL